MAPKARTVTAKSLQALLNHIGSIGSATKDVLRARFSRDVRRPRLFDLRPDWKQRLSHNDPRFRKLRIMSIDMGVKNLAYCHAEVSYPAGDTMKPRMDVERWEKINLVDATQDLRRPLPHEKKDLGDFEDKEVDPYSLNVLSATAYSFLTRTALELSPDIILIEKQRWRSGSSAAILQWTVRVNTLEAMLWAILETLKTERLLNTARPKDEVKRRNYEVYGVDPRSVGQYWLGQHARAMAEKAEGSILALVTEEEPTVKVTRSKAEKKAKIRLLRSWLSAEPASTASSTPNKGPTISFTISDSAAATRKALCLPARSGARKKKIKASEDGDDANLGNHDVTETTINKLDDITDCFLQAAAWVAWETNRLQLWDVWYQKNGQSGELPPLDEEILREMVEVAEKGGKS